MREKAETSIRFRILFVFFNRSYILEIHGYAYDCAL